MATEKPESPPVTEAPEGSLESEDSGLVMFRLTRKDKLVHLLFDRPCGVLSLTPKQAHGMAMGLLRLSAEIIKEGGNGKLRRVK